MGAELYGLGEERMNSNITWALVGDMKKYIMSISTHSTMSRRKLKGMFYP